MKHTPYRRGAFRLLLLGCLLAGIFALLAGTLPTAAHTTAETRAAANCGDGLYFSIENDTVLSGTVYVDGTVTVRAGAMVTITPGTDVLFCGNYDFNVNGLFNHGFLHARGTVTQPIRFMPAPGVDNWGRLGLYDPNEDRNDPRVTVLQHVVLSNSLSAGSDRAALYVVDGTYNETPGVIVDNVTIHNSGGHGISLNRIIGEDPSPAAVSNLTIEQSNGRAVLADPSAVDGMTGRLTLRDNMTDTIYLRGDNLNGRITWPVRWRNFRIPYEMGGSIALRDHDDDSETGVASLNIDPGVEVMVHPGRNLTVGSLYGKAEIDFRGTAVNPITFTRLSADSDPWGSIWFDHWNSGDHHLEHVALLYGGGLGNPDTTDGVINLSANENIVLEDVTIRHSQNYAVEARTGRLRVYNSTFADNRAGIYADSSIEELQITGSTFGPHAEMAINNDDPTRLCVFATGNFWGSGNGPADSSNAEDACGPGKANSGGGAAVSDGVRYTPWLPGQDLQNVDRGYISAEKSWVIATGTDTAELTVVLRDPNGQPLSGKEVRLETTIGAVQQPTELTNAQGRTTAVISSTAAGFASISAYNVTDDKPVVAQAGVTFWQGHGNTGGLVDLSGAPYATPQLQVIEPPFFQGTPIDFRLPMQNSTAEAQNVEVVYRVTGLNIGTRYTPVYTATELLDPGESWDAPGVWLPDVTGHHCIQATVTFDGVTTTQTVSPAESTTTADDLTTSADELLTAENSARAGGFNSQVNTDQNPCEVTNSGPRDFSPGRPAFNGRKDLKKAGKHFKGLGGLFGQAIRCLNQDVDFLRGPDGFLNSHDYTEIVTPPTYDPLTITADADITPAQADVLNDLAVTANQIYAHGLAIGATAQRMHWAAQADKLGWLDEQYVAYRQFHRDYAGYLNTFADQIDDYLALTADAGVPDGYYYPADYTEELAQLKNSGFDAELVSQYQAIGLSLEQIEALRQDRINLLENIPAQTISFYEVLRGMRDNARDVAADLLDRYPPEATRTAANGPATLSENAMTFEFEVGHRNDSQSTVDLVVRPLNLPLDWSYNLSQASYTLGVTETATAELTLIPGREVVEGDQVELAVEGYVDGELIDGIVFTYDAPMVSSSRNSHEMLLPFVQR